MEESIMVMEKARPHLAKLRDLAVKLNEASDRYTQEIADIEYELSQLNIGIEVELDERPILEGNTFEETDQYGEPTGVTHHNLWAIGYGRVSTNRSGWELVAREYTVYSDDRGWILQRATPLLEASRDVRIASAKQIPALLEKLAKEVEGKVGVLNEVSDKIKR
jgi:hypothetical protein